MKQIDNTFLKNIKNDLSSKESLCKDEKSLAIELVNSLRNMEEFIINNFSLYETTLSIIEFEKYRKNKFKHVTYKYYSKDIILANLGNNCGNELSYQHPCVVLKSEYDKVFVIPCSSSKMKKSRDKDKANAYGFFNTDTTLLFGINVKFKEYIRL